MFNFYNFKCTNCEHEWETNIGAYPVSSITDNPCVKCQSKGTIVAEKVRTKKKATTNKSAMITNHTADRCDGKGFKKGSDEFRSLLKKIKKEHPGSTIKDRW